ncbi:MAG: DUF1329 domain-containing protein, partial [Candidatus Binataceae bacterium]
PQQRAGYCYGKRIMYLDKQNFTGLWQDLYDAGMKLWKVNYLLNMAGPVPGAGVQMNDYHLVVGIYDVQQDHMNILRIKDVQNQECRNLNGRNFDNVARYSTAAGLSLILR